jgi:hypothetical protein
MHNIQCDDIKRNYGNNVRASLRRITPRNIYLLPVS